MTESFSHLVWLGAGQAREPMGLMQKAKKITLVEAREPAFLKLEQQFRQSNVAVSHQLITLTGNKETFIEYNLPEYSGIQEAEGLKRIFPGLKTIDNQTVESVSINKLISDLALTDNKNLLVIDILDINLKILECLYKTGEIYRFVEIYVLAANDHLYADSADARQIDNFLQGVGYFIRDRISIDIDFSWMIFVLNPNWSDWEKTKRSHNDLVDDIQQVKFQLEEQQQQNKELLKEIDVLKQQPPSHQNAIDKLKMEVAQVNKIASIRKDLISGLEKEKLILEIANKQLNQRIRFLEEEMAKVEAQTEIIKEFFLMQPKD